MNGLDWPSPAANLQNIEAEIKEVLAATGVHVPSLMGMPFSIFYFVRSFPLTVLRLYIL